MDIRQLELLLAVLEAPTMTKAAARMKISTAAVSIQLRTLAEELHTELFVRNGRTLLPTPAALRLATYARNILGQCAEIKEQFANDPAADTRPFQFAVGATTLIYRLGKPLRLLRKQLPQLDLHVSVMATEEMVTGLQSRQFDLGLISLPLGNTGLRITPLYQEELLILKPSPARIQGNHVGNIKAAELNGKPFLLYPTSSNMRTLIERYCSELGIAPRVVMEAADTEAIKGLVEAGFGYSILPEYALRAPSKFFHTLRIPSKRLFRQQALAEPDTEQPRALTKSIAEFLQKQLGDETPRG